jgi:hypothetical protein
MQNALSGEPVVTYNYLRKVISDLSIKFRDKVHDY